MIFKSEEGLLFLQIFLLFHQRCQMV